MTQPSRTSSARSNSQATVVAWQIAPTPDTPEEISVSLNNAAGSAERRDCGPRFFSSVVRVFRPAHRRERCRAEARSHITGEEPRASKAEVLATCFLHNASILATGRVPRSETKASRGGRTQMQKASICASRDSRPGGPKGVSPRRELWVDDACPFPCPPPPRGRGGSKTGWGHAYPHGLRHGLNSFAPARGWRVAHLRGI